MIIISLVAIVSLAAGQGAVPQTEEYARYAVYSAAFASSISYCRAKHGEMQRPASKRCFNRAKQTLSTEHLDATAARITVECRNPATRQTCLVPELGPVIEQITRRFAEEGL